MQPYQLPLFSSEDTRPFNVPFPSTRYQGSKRKLVEWIWENVSGLTFETVLDVFGGTGVVSHLFKNAGKQVTYNDLLAFNYEIGRALIENNQHTLSNDELDTIIYAQSEAPYPNVIQRNFSGIYFTDEENAWLDRIIINIQQLIANPYKQAIARFALFQACIIKRPYNLFHRANLYMRTSEVKRTFGNKTTWDAPFEVHFRSFVEEANQAVFDNGRANQVLQCDAAATPTGYDLVYIDPPYLNKKGTGVDYRDFYHFLEGIVNYDTWEMQIDTRSKHRRLRPVKSPWSHQTTILSEFERLIQHHQASTLVVSYRDDGIPSKQDLVTLLQRYKGQVIEAAQPMQYVLSTKRSHELLLIAV